MKKVVFLIESFSLGGAEKVLVDIANNLNVGAYQVSVCALFRESVYGKRYPYKMKLPFNGNIRFHYLFDNRSRWISLLANFCLSRFPAKVYGFFIRDRFDIAVAFYEGAPTRLLAAAKLKRGKKMAWLHTSTELSQKGKTEEDLRREQERYAEFERIVAVSQFVADSFSRLFPELSDRIVTAYNPIDVEGIRGKAADSVPFSRGPEPLLVSVGRMTGAKAYDRYLRVVRDLKSRGFSFQVWIAGGGDRSELEVFCRENGLDNVTFLGNQPNPYPLMKMADWIILPSRTEGLPTVVLESLALGKAVLATDCGGTREILGESEYGLLSENNETCLCKALVGVLSDQIDRRQYELKALQRSRDFSLEARIPQIENILNG